MTIIGWVLSGLVAGFIASKFLGRNGERVLPYLVVGVIGAAIGGYVFDMVDTAQPTGFVNMSSVFMSLGGAVALLVAHHTIRGRLFKSG